MPKSQPMYRKISSTPAGVPFTVEPAGSASGCVLIEKVTQDGQPVVFFRLYVGKGIGGSGTAKAEYTPTGDGSFWVVDITEPNVIDLDEALVAIANGKPGLPDGPIVWGHG